MTVNVIYFYNIKEIMPYLILAFNHNNDHIVVQGGVRGK